MRLFGWAGVARRKQGDLEGAARAFESALALRRATGYRQGEGMQLYNLGVIYTELDQTDRARGCLEAALEIFGEDGGLFAELAQKQLARLEAQASLESRSNPSKPSVGARVTRALLRAGRCVTVGG